MKTNFFLCLAFTHLLAFEVGTAQQQPPEPVNKIESPNEIMAKLGDLSEGLLHDGDRLTFMFRSDAVKVKLTNMINAKIEKQGRNGPWLGQVDVPESSKLLMSYAFTENEQNGWNQLKEYRGPDAPPLPRSSFPIKGQVFKYQIKSKHLGGYRKFEVYMPAIESSDPLPVVYMTDGQAFDRYTGPIDWKIENGEIQPIIVVAIHNGGYVGDRNKVQSIEFDYRAKEYLGGLGDERYEQHCSFLIEEVMPFVEENHNASSDKSKRALSGYSNGGAYVLTASVDHPDLFGHVFPYSVAFFDRDDLKENLKGKSDKLPKYRFAAGILEHFIKGTQESHAIVKDAGVDAEIRTYVAGHDPLLWKVALLEDLQAIFPGSEKKQSP